MEHADGSFMDHLTFGRDYCAEHYPGVRPPRHHPAPPPRLVLTHSLFFSPAGPRRRGRGEAGGDGRERVQDNRVLGGVALQRPAR